MAGKDAALSHRALALVGLALLAGCALPDPYRPPATTSQAVPGLPPVPAPPVESQPQATATAPAPATPPPPPVQRAYRLGPAAQSLVTQARAQIGRGELPGASTTLDRALRIEPQNPLLWIELARLRLTEGDPRQAEGCARKALALGSADPIVRQQAGRLLADALRGQHREREARALESQPWLR